jgi:AraC-like DNA-binding protein
MPDPRRHLHNDAHSSVPRGSRVVVALVKHDALGRVQTALWPHALISLQLVDELLPAAHGNALSLVVTEPWDAAGNAVSASVRWLKAAYPSVPVIAYCEQNARSHREAVSLVRAGIDALMLQGIDDGPTAFRAAVDDARHGCVATEVIRAVRPFLPPDAAAFVEYCLRQATTSPSVGGAAAAFGIDRKTLLNRLARRQLPRPRDIRAWTRLLLAARLLEDDGRSVEQVGLALGCGSGSALCSLFLRHTGLRPAAIRRLGGMRHVLTLFVTSLRTAVAAHVGSRSEAANIVR